MVATVVLVAGRAGTGPEAVGEVKASRPSIFISYSARDAKTSKLLGRLTTALDQAGFDSFVDREKLRRGEYWRPELQRQLHRCQGAVVILSPSALESKWVFQEAAVLQVRKSAEGDGFSLIPILLDGVTPDQLKDSDLGSLELDSLHMPSNDRHDLDLEIVDLLAPVMEHYGPQRPLHLLEIAIADLLSGLSDSSLSAAADALGLNLSGWVPEGKPWAVARRMLQVELSPFEEAILRICVQLQEKALDVINMVIPFTWIGAQSVAPIIDAVDQRSNGPVLAINSRLSTTGEMYVRRACCRPSPWDVANVLSPQDEAYEESLVKEVRLAVAEKLGFDWGEEFTDDEFQWSLERHGPVIVLLSPPADDASLARLRQAFPLIVFLLLAGDEDPTTLQLMDIVPLDPPLDRRLESESLRRYKVLRRKVTPKVITLN